MPAPEAGRKMFFYEGFARDWDAQMDAHELGKRLRLVFGKLLHEPDIAGRLVLDAGAGTGHFSRVLARQGARLVSMDLGANLLAEVRKKCATRAVAGSLLELPFADGAFDAVLCTEVIEHTTDPRRAVSELCRVVAPGGVLVVTVPNRFWKIAVIVANALKLRPYHGLENWVGYAQLAAWIGDQGLAIEDHRGFNLLPHTQFCRPAFDRLDLPALYPFMINIAVRARRPL